MKLPFVALCAVWMVTSCSTLYAATAEEEKLNSLEKALRSQTVVQNQDALRRLSNEERQTAHLKLLENHPEGTIEELGELFYLTVDSASLANEKYSVHYLRVLESVPANLFTQDPVKMKNEGMRASYYLLTLYRRSHWEDFTVSSVQYLNNRLDENLLTAKQEKEHIDMLKSRLSTLKLPSSLLAVLAQERPLNEVQDLFFHQEIPSTQSTIELSLRLNQSSTLTRMQYYPAGWKFDEDHSYRQAVVK